MDNVKGLSVASHQIVPLSLELAVAPPRSQYRPLESDEVELGLHNKGPKSTYISRVFARFDWDIASPFYRDANLTLKPGMKGEVSIGFAIGLQATEGSHQIEYGVESKTLDDNTWSKPSTSWFRPGDHFLVEASPPRGFAVFVNHSNDTKDKARLRQLTECLLRTGFEPLLAERTPRPGYPLWKKIRGLIQRADGAVILWTEAAANSGDVREEVGLAFGRGETFPILPIIEKGNPVKGSLGGLEFSEYSGADDESAYPALEEVLTELIALAEKKGPRPATKSE